RCVGGLFLCFSLFFFWLAEPETSGRYSFNHPKIGSDSFVRGLAPIFRQSRRDSGPGSSESVATGDQKADGKNDPPIERSCLTKNFAIQKSSELTRLERSRASVL